MRKHRQTARELRSSNGELPLPIIPFGIYAFTLQKDNLSRNSCILHERDSCCRKTVTFYVQNRLSHWLITARQRKPSEQVGMLFCTRHLIGSNWNALFSFCPLVGYLGGLGYNSRTVIVSGVTNMLQSIRLNTLRIFTILPPHGWVVWTTTRKVPEKFGIQHRALFPYLSRLSTKEHETRNIRHSHVRTAKLNYKYYPIVELKVYSVD